MTHRTIATMQTVKDADALVELLHKLNEAGEWPNLPFVDQQGIAGVAYGIEAGDEMAVAYLSDPGEDRMRSDGHDHDDTESYIALFEGDVYELHGPIVVLVPGSSERESG